MITTFDTTEKEISTGVRDLIGFWWLPASLRISASPIDVSARQRRHNSFQKTMEEEGWRREVSVSLSREVNGVSWRIRGRIDLLRETANGIEIIELKTCFHSDPERDPLLSNLDHALQLFFYALAVKADTAFSGKRITATLLYLPMEENTAPEPIDLDLDGSVITGAWDALLEGVTGELMSQSGRRTAQLKAIETFTFPFSDLRPGQKEIVTATEYALMERTRVVLQAPAGTGKTVAVLTGALPETVRQNLALFFLTAKNTHKKIVEETLQRIAARGLHVRTLFMTAKETLCLNDTETCSPESCPWAEVFADRVREHDLLERLLDIDVITPDQITALAKEAVVCPFELSLVLSTRCDLIVCDYNYVFDPHVYLRRFFMDDSSSCRCAILIDEAANLPSRAREYYSPEIRLSWLETLLPFQNAHKKPFRALLAPWRKLFRECSERLSEEDGVEIELSRDTNLPLKERKWHSAMLEQREFPGELLDISRAIQDFARISRITDERFHLLFREERNDSVLQWFCTDAADFLAERHDLCHSTVAFSATLSPIAHFTSLLGLDRGERRAADTMLIPYPFPRENLSVMIDPTLDTRYRSRQAQLPLLTGRIREIAAEAPGTWLLFFPSYDYLGMTADILQDCGVPILRQVRGMSASERTEFISDVESGAHLALTVSGGIFSEGIDLRIPDLKGAMVVGPCLPGIDLRSRLLSERFQVLEKDGFLHTWVIPGMNRVIQAAGRLVRSPEDRAQLILLGRRFTRHPYVNLLPAHWFRDGRIELLSPSEHSPDV